MHPSTRISRTTGLPMPRLRSGVPTAVLLLAALACQDQQSDPMLAPTDQSANATANQWITRANMPTDRINTTTATVKNARGRTILYVIGGRNPSSTAASCSGGLSKVQAYDATANTWRTKAPFPAPIQLTNGAGVIDGKIYITGGCTGFKNYSGWTWMYDPGSNTWTRKRPMPVDTYNGVSGVIQGKLYVLSSCDGQEDCGNFSNLFFGRYDPATDAWTELPLPPSKSHHQSGAAAVIGGKLYVAGGAAFTQAVEVYDPATNQWSTGASMGSRRERVASAAVGGKLYVIAGVRVELTEEGGIAFTPVPTTSVYDPATDSWRNVRPAPRSGPGLAAGRVVVNGQARIELVGGARPGNNLQYVPR